MNRSFQISAVVGLVAMVGSTSVARAQAPASFVLVERGITTRAMGKSYTTPFLVPATVGAKKDGSTSVTFEDGVTEPRPDAEVKPLEWSAGTQLRCRAQGKKESDFITYTLKVLEGDKVRLNPGYGADITMPILMCSQTHPFAWYFGMSDYYKGFAKYKEIKAAPTAKRADPNPAEIKHAFGVHLQGADGGAYLQIKDCAVTGAKWNELQNAGSKVLSAREVPVACTVAVPLPPKPKENFQCLVVYGTCRENHLGLGKYTACQYSTAEQTPDRIACPKGK